MFLTLLNVILLANNNVVNYFARFTFISKGKYIPFLSQRIFRN